MSHPVCDDSAHGHRPQTFPHRLGRMDRHPRLREDQPKAVEPWTLGPEWLAKWKHAPHVPVLNREGDTPLEPLISVLVSATENNRELEFLYHGGSTPGQSRRVTPGLVFQAGGFPGTYLSGYCHTRRAERVFRGELIELYQKAKDGDFNTPSLDIENAFEPMYPTGG